MRDPLVERWMVEIRQAEITRDRECIGFVDAEPKGEGEGEPGGEKGRNDGPSAPICSALRRSLLLVLPHRLPDLLAAPLLAAVNESVESRPELIAQRVALDQNLVLRPVDHSPAPATKRAAPD